MYIRCHKVNLKIMFETDYTVTRATYDHLSVNGTPFHLQPNHNFCSSQDLVNDYQLPTLLDFSTTQEEADYAPNQTGKAFCFPSATSDQGILLSPQGLPTLSLTSF